MKISSQNANELGLNILQLIGYTKFNKRLDYCPGGEYTKEHLYDKLLEEMATKGYSDDYILVNFNYIFYDRTNSGGYYGICGSGDLYKISKNKDKPSDLSKMGVELVGGY